MSQESTTSPASAELTTEERDRAFFAETIGQVVSIPLATSISAFQHFYYCLLHAGMGFSGDVATRPLLRSEDPGAQLRCTLCHQGLASVAYLEEQIAIRRAREASTNSES